MVKPNITVDSRLHFSLILNICKTITLVFYPKFYEIQMEIKSKCKVYDGYLFRISHSSSETKTKMTFAIYLPGNFNSADFQCQQGASLLPSIVYLSGLTCTDENVCQKSGIFKTLSELKVNHNIH